VVRLYAAFICGALAGPETRTKLLLQARLFPPVQPPVNRIIKQGRFGWGSFSAFEDGSFEVERAGVDAVVSKLFRVRAQPKEGRSLQKSELSVATLVHTDVRKKA
jgi:hypothetical protein